MADDPASPRTPDSQETGEFAVRPILDSARPPGEEAPIDVYEVTVPAAHPPVMQALPHRKPDKWAHRRGEPRMLVLFWSVYLMASAIVTVFSVRLLGPPQQSAFRPAAQSLLTLAGIGVGVLWPMVRLSQAMPLRARRSALADIIAISLPLQAIVWPTRLLTAWAWSVVGGIALMLFCWTVLMSALIAAATSHAGPATASGAAEFRPGEAADQGPTPGRGVWMLACLFVASGAPALMLLGGLVGLTPSPAGWLASPITASFAMTDAPSGLSARMSAGEWFAAVLPGVIGLACWAVMGVWGSSGQGGVRPGGRAGSGLQ